MRHNFLITGANGFVGSALVAALYQRSQFVRRAMRVPMDFENGIESVAIGNIDGQTDWREAEGRQAVTHRNDPENRS